MSNLCVGYWKFDEGTGTTSADSSGNGNVVDLNGTTWGTGPSFPGGRYNGSCIQSSSFAYASSNDTGMPSGSNPRSISLWGLMSSGSPQKEALLYWGTDTVNRNFGVYVDVTGELFLDLGGEVVLNSGFGGLNSSTWFHFVVTYDGSTIVVYLNGVSGDSFTGITLNTTLNGTLYFGGPAGLNGALDEVMVFNYALTPTQVSGLYSGVTSGFLDGTFGSFGWSATQFNLSGVPGDSTFKAMTIQNDNKIIAVGEIVQSANYNLVIARYEIDGNIDTTFASGQGYTTLSVDSFSDYAYSVAIQNDGKIVVGGYCGNSPYNLFFAARLNTDGSVDTNFGSPNGYVTYSLDSLENKCYSIVVQPNQYIVLAGQAGGISSTIVPGIIRLDTTGSLDGTFNSSGVLINPLTDAFGFSTTEGELMTSSGDLLNAALAGNAFATAITIQPDGKLVTCDQNTDGDAIVVRYNSDGSFDSSFGTNGLAVYLNDSDYFYNPTCIVIQNDGKFITGGYAELKAGSGYIFFAARFNTDGTVDTSFGVNGVTVVRFTPIGTTPNDVCNGITLQSDGSVILSGSTNPNFGSNTSYAMCRLLNTGSLDTSFGINGLVIATPANASYVAQKGFSVATQSVADSVRIIFGGSISGGGPAEFALGRFFQGTGSGDPHFTGFLGQEFDFMGKTGKFYCLLSDWNIQCNALFDACRGDYRNPEGYYAEWNSIISRYDIGCHPLEDRRKSDLNHIKHVGIKIGIKEITKMLYATDASPVINKCRMIKNKIYKLSGGKALWDGETLRVATSNYNIEVSQHLEFGEAMIDFKVANIGTTIAHGIIGQTVTGEPLVNEECEVSGIYSDDFKFNRFGEKPKIRNTKNKLYDVSAS